MTPTEAITALEKALEAGSLHSAILNIPSAHEEVGIVDRLDILTYKHGHRDARHAAAELANERDIAIRTLLDAHAGALRDAEALRAALRVIAEVTPNGWHKDDGAHVANSFIHSARAALATNTKAQP